MQSSHQKLPAVGVAYSLVTQSSFFIGGGARTRGREEKSSGNYSQDSAQLCQDFDTTNQIALVSQVTAMSHKTSLSRDILPITLITRPLFFQSYSLYRRQVAAAAITMPSLIKMVSLAVACMLTLQNIMQTSQNMHFNGRRKHG